MMHLVVTVLSTAACCLAPVAAPSPPVHALVSAQAPDKPFIDVSVSSGINLVGRGRGCAWGDLDGDGLLDLGVGIQEDGFHLFRNLGGLKFRETTMEAGITTAAGTNFGVSFVDLDNDKDLDIFLCFGGYQNFNRHPQPNRLYLNDGDWNFREVEDAAGLALPGYNFSASWSDINGDGWLDVFLCRVNSDEATGENRLFLNHGELQFEDVTVAAGIQTTAFSQQAIFFDIEQDGDPDLFFTNRHAATAAATVVGFHHDVGLWAVDELKPPGCGCGGPEGEGCRCGLPADAPARIVCPCVHESRLTGAPAVYTVGSRLFRNDGTGHFVDISDEAGVGDSQGTFPAAAGDYDNDGDMDLFVGTFNYGPREVYFPGYPDRLYQNDGRGKFRDVAAQAGVADFGGPMGCTMIDFDNDGWLDIFTARGGPEPTRYEYDRFYRNNRDGTFTEVGRSVGIVNAGAGHGASAADADSDGDMDLFIPNGAMVPERSAPQLLYENRGNGNSWIQVRPEGDGGNLDAVNARIALTAGTMSRYHEITAGNSFGSMTPMNAFFGLAEHEMVDRLTITWRCGLTRTAEHVVPRRSIVALLPVDFAAQAPVVEAESALKNPAERLQQADSRSVQLSWDDTRVPGIGRYELAVWSLDASAGFADDPAPASLTDESPEAILTQSLDVPMATVVLPAGRYRWSVSLFDELGRVSGAIDPAPFEITIAAPPPPASWSASPNPFVDAITIHGPAESADTGSSEGSKGTAQVYDVRGRFVAELSGTPEGGVLTLIWNGRDHVGRPVPDGIYFVRLETREEFTPIKIVRAGRREQ